MSPKKVNPYTSLNTSLAQSTDSARRRGLLRFSIGLASVLIVYAVFRWLLPYFGLEPTTRGYKLVAIPGALALLGLIEAITGIPYGEMARRWEHLKGWQRGIISFGIIFTFGGGVLYLLYHLINY